MPGMMDRGMTMFSRAMKVGAGRTVTYTRKSDARTLTPTAWVGNTLFAREIEDSGATRVWGERDYLLSVADLTLDGTPITPARGDRVTETIDGTPTTFEVSPPEGEPAWRYSDNTRTVFRLHCKRVT